MASRLKLHEVLCEILGSRNVYFQPPTSLKMKYPAIRYSLKKIDIAHANNCAYKHDTAYELTGIDFDPDSELAMKILEIPKSSFDRSYAADDLNHWVFTLYY